MPGRQRKSTRRGRILEKKRKGPIGAENGKMIIHRILPRRQELAGQWEK